MKNFKRTLALVLAVIMVAGMFASVSAAKNTAWYSEGVRYIESIGVATIGNTADEKITRDEFVLWIAKIESGNVKDAYWTGAANTIFTDVTEENNQVAIKYSQMRGFIEGNGDGTFAPDKNITLGEAAAVIVRLMRYQSKVESNGENWAWAHMEVANEYCKAFNYTFRNNVGGGIYDYDYELTKGEAAYLLATVMNGVEGQVDKNYFNKPVYKSLTIDGHNLGEMFVGHTNVAAYGDVYYVSSISFEEDGTVMNISGKDVFLTPLNEDNEVIRLDYDDFTSLVRVSLGLTAEAEEDEAEICVQDTVKAGNLVDVTLDKDGEIIALEVNSGSTVVDTHIVQYAMLQTDAAARLNWTTNNLVTGTTTSSVDREAAMNSTWTSDLLFTWTVEEDGSEATLTFKGEEYDFVVENGKVVSDLKVLRSYGNGLVDVVEEYNYSIRQIVTMMPTVAEGEVTLIFNDEDSDGAYDSVVVNEAGQYFDVQFFDGSSTVQYNYYYDGYIVNDKTPSNKLQLLVRAAGRQEVVYNYAFETPLAVADGESVYTVVRNTFIALEAAGVKTPLNERGVHYVYNRNSDRAIVSVDVVYTLSALDSDADHKINEPIANHATDAVCPIAKAGKPCNNWNHYTDRGVAMNPYQLIDAGNIQAGVIEESVLYTAAGESYFRVKVKLAGGAYQTVYIPVPHTVVPDADAKKNQTTDAFSKWVKDGKFVAAGTEGATQYTLGNVNADGEVVKEAFYADNYLTFEYAINGATSEAEVYWNYNDKVAFAFDALTLTGIDTDSTGFANKAAKLVGQYISFMVDEDNVATYCVSGVAGTGETGYLLDVAESDVENMYNVTIATVDKNGVVEDVEIYSVNATASTMFAGADAYSKITAIFNKGTVSESDLVNYTKNTVNVDNGDKSFTTTKAIKLDTEIDTLTAVTVKSNGTFSYIEVIDTDGIDTERAGIWNEYLNAENPDVVAGNDTNKFGKVSSTTGSKHAKGDYYPVSANDSDITATTQYQGKFYSQPSYVYNEAEKVWVLTVYTQTITLDYTFGVDSANVTSSNILKLDDADLIAAFVSGTNAANTKVTEWKPNVTLHIDAKGVVRGVEAYTAANDFQRGTELVMNGDTYTTVDGTVDTYKIAGEVAIVDGVVTVNYDFRGIDKTYTVTSAKITESFKKDNVTYTGATDTDKAGFYTFSGATASADNVKAALNAVAEDIANIGKVNTSDDLSRTEYADVYAGTKALNIGYTVNSVRTPVNAKSSISNVTFTAMASTETGYIPGSYWFSIDAENTIYFDKTAKTFLGYTTDKEADEVTTATRKYRVTSTTEVVLLTPTAAGWNVEVMTPAEAAKLDLIVAGYSFVDSIAAGAPKSDAYNAYNYKLDAIVLVGQEALVETEKEVVDDGKDVSKDEYLVYVPSDAETSLYAPEGSKTIKVISNKSVYAVPSGTEIGSIYYEYNAYTGAEMPTIKSVIKSGWYLVEADGEIIEEFTWATGKKKDITVSVDAGKIVAEDADENAVDVSKAVLFYYDINGTLKKVSDAKVTFASGSIFTTAMKSATDALNTAKANLAVYGDSAKYSAATVAKYEAAYEAAVVAYNEALAANIDKYFNGNIWDSFKTVASNEAAIQGAAEYKVTYYTVDDTTFIIVNTWSVDANGIVTVGSALK